MSIRVDCSMLIRYFIWLYEKQYGQNFSNISFSNLVPSASGIVNESVENDTFLILF